MFISVLVLIATVNVVYLKICSRTTCSDFNCCQLINIGTWNIDNNN